MHQGKLKLWGIPGKSFYDTLGNELQIKERVSRVAPRDKEYREDTKYSRARFFPAAVPPRQADRPKAARGICPSCQKPLELQQEIVVFYTTDADLPDEGYHLGCEPEGYRVEIVEEDV